MEFDFLKKFPRRMESIGAYALLFRNSMQKGTWKQMGFEEFYEQTNLVFAVLLYIMEQSLKEEPCTMDDVGTFLDSINLAWFKKELSYEDCRKLGDFIINVVLCDEGRPMYFQGFDFEEGKYRPIYISFVGNKVIYLEGDVKRTSYFLTEAGYNLMLSTLEIEGNLKLTIQEMVFKLHLEKASYDRAVDDVKGIFNLLRIQYQKIEEAMRRIRKNALDYSVEDYKRILEEDLATIGDTREKFIEYRNLVRDRVKKLEEQDINIRKLEIEDEKNLKNLKTIEGYLNRALDEHQRIFSGHFDLKTLYSDELEALSQMALIRRFQFRSELYDKIIQDVTGLGNLEYFLRPLFKREPEKTYNLNKALEFQKPVRKRILDEEGELLSVEDPEWLLEQNRRKEERLSRYRDSVRLILSFLHRGGGTLGQLKDSLTEEERGILIPSVEIFKEILIEFVKIGTVDLEALRKEKEEYLEEGVSAQEFQLNLCILGLVEENPLLDRHKRFTVRRASDRDPVIFENIADESGMIRKIKCSNLILEAD